MTSAAARPLLALFMVALFVGTLMPGSWKADATRPFDSVLDAAVWAHVGLFAVITWLASAADLWRVRLWQLPLLGLALALLTEGLQFFAINRHPNLAGVAQDLAGTLLGCGLVLARRRQLAARKA